jgi:hypothetical protein
VFCAVPCVDAAEATVTPPATRPAVMAAVAPSFLTELNLLLRVIASPLGNLLPTLVTITAK